MEKRDDLEGLCAKCANECYGHVQVIERGPMIRIVADPTRNWILCDSCNTLLCHDCCSYPQSGYCDGCISRYDLWEFLAEMRVDVVFCEECQLPICPSSLKVPESHLCDSCVKPVLDSFSKGGGDVH